MAISGFVKPLKDKQGNYIFPETSSEAVYCPDGKTIEDKFSNIGSTLEQNKKQLNSVLNVKFPPPPIKNAIGDGITDDTESINSCIVYAIKNKMSVYIPAGVYKGNFKIDYSTLYTEVPTWDELAINLSIFGDGDSTILTNNSGTIFSIISYPQKEKYFRYMTLSNFQIIGDGDETNPPPVKGMELIRYQQLNVDNVRILKCGNGGVHIWGGFDSQWNNIDIIFCGHATSDEDYAYALQLRNSISPVTNSNANKFTNLRIEKAPCMFFVDGDCKENYIQNFKFEKGTINDLDIHRPILIDYCGDLNFQNGMFVNNQMTFDDGTMQEHEHFKYYLISNINDNIKANTPGYSERVKFTNCDFIAANSWQAGSWIKGSNMTFIACSINGGMGEVGTSEKGNERQPPIHFTDNCIMRSCTTQTFWRSRNMKISGQFNDVEFMIMNKRATQFDKGMVLLDDNAKNNTIKLSIECLGYGQTLDGIEPFEIPDFYKKTIGEVYPLDIGTNKFSINTSDTINIKTAGGTLFNKFSTFITFDNLSELKGVKHTYDGMKITFVATGSLKVYTTGNLRTKTGTTVSLTSGQHISFAFYNGIGYEI